MLRILQIHLETKLYLLLFNPNSYSPVSVELENKIVLGISVERMNRVVSTFQLLFVIVIKVRT